MGVTLKYPATGSVTSALSLPWPAHDQSIGTDPNQSVYTSADGSTYTAIHGPPRYQIARVFESLTETEWDNLTTFLTACNYSFNKILFCYHDAVTNVDVSVPCKIIQDPKRVRRMLNIIDVTLVFEQLVHPDNISEQA